MSGTASSASAGSDDEIRLRVETISGEVIQLVVSKHETVLKLKNRIFKKQGIPVAEQNLMFLEEELKDFHTLNEYNIIDSCTIKLSIGMKGGPINTRRTLYLDDKNTIQEMAKMLAAHDISVVLVPHNGAFHVIPVASDKRDGAQCSVERRHSTRHSVAKLMEGGHQQQSQPQHQAQQAGSGGRRVEENKATKSKMVALQKQFKKKRSALGQIPAMISRQGGCCASNLQKSILSDAMPPLAAAPVALVAAGGAGAEAAEHQHKVVVPRLITSHPHISLNELNPSQTFSQFYTATTATADGGGAFQSSSSYSSGVERNVVFYPTAGASGSGGSSSSGGEAIFVSPYKGLFRCTADTTENSSKEDVSSGSGRCSSAAAAPPPADNSPTVVERPQSVNQSQTSTTNATGSAGASSTSGQLNGAKGQLLSSQATPSTEHQSKNVDDAVAAATAASPNKDEVKVERRIEDKVPEPEVTVEETREATSATPPKKKHPRCLVCNKKTGLASSYTCRCGGNFCATHRYAEAHNCGHDYKTEGRQQLEKSNPLIQAAKLQKI